MKTDRLGIAILEANQCWSCCGHPKSVAWRCRSATTRTSSPVNFVVEHGNVVFRTAEGTKLAAAVLGTAVAFEVDGYDAEAARRGA